MRLFELNFLTALPKVLSTASQLAANIGYTLTITVNNKQSAGSARVKTGQAGDLLFDLMCCA